MKTVRQRLEQDLLPDDPRGPEAQNIVAQARQHAEQMEPGDGLMPGIRTKSWKPMSLPLRWIKA